MVADRRARDRQRGLPRGCSSATSRRYVPAVGARRRRAGARGRPRPGRRPRRRAARRLRVRARPRTRCTSSTRRRPPRPPRWRSRRWWRTASTALSGADRAPPEQPAGAPQRGRDRLRRVRTGGGVVRHWLSQTPSIRLAIAHARSFDRRVRAQREAEVVERRVEHRAPAAPATARARPCSGRRPARSTSRTARRSATAPRGRRSRRPARRRAAARAPTRRRRGRRPRRRRRGSPPGAGYSICSIQSPALSASSIVSAWNAAWLPNRLVMAPRVLPSCAATAFGVEPGERADGDRAPRRAPRSPRRICSSTASSPIST